MGTAESALELLRLLGNEGDRVSRARFDFFLLAQAHLQQQRAAAAVLNSPPSTSPLLKRLQAGLTATRRLLFCCCAPLTGQARPQPCPHAHAPSSSQPAAHPSLVTSSSSHSAAKSHSVGTMHLGPGTNIATDSVYAFVAPEHQLGIRQWQRRHARPLDDPAQPSSFSFLAPPPARQQALTPCGSLAAKGGLGPAGDQAGAAGHQPSWMSGGGRGEAAGRQVPPPRSVLGLGMLSVASPMSGIWYLFMLLWDAVYVAFFVPLSIAFCHDVFGTWGGCSWAELASGLVFFVNILLKLHTAVVLRHLHKRLEVVEGRLVCRYYILHGSCWLDVLGALPGLYQLLLILLPRGDVAVSVGMGRAFTLIQAVRLLRVTSLLKQLYLEVSTGTLHHAVSRWMSGITLYAGLLMYAAALAVNFYACILVFIAEVAGLADSWPSTNANLDLSQGSTLQLYGVAVYWVIQTMTSVWGHVPQRHVGDGCDVCDHAHWHPDARSAGGQRGGHVVVCLGLCQAHWGTEGEDD